VKIVLVHAGGVAPKVCPETPHRAHYKAREKMRVKIVLVHAGGVRRQRFVLRPSPACITAREMREDCAGARWWGVAPKVCPETLTGVHYKQERR
jgi:hypothetical protein